MTDIGCCSVDSGILGCGKDNEPDKISDLGLGISVYFKIVKAFAICFFVICLINLPLYTIYSLNNTARPIATYRDALFKTTIGNLASCIYIFIQFLAYTPCQKLPITDIYNQTKYLFELDCGNYAFETIDQFGLAQSKVFDVTNTLNCLPHAYIQNLTFNPFCDDASYLKIEANSTCAMKKGQCNFTADMTDIQNTCKNYTAEQNFFYLTYICISKIRYIN